MCGGGKSSRRTLAGAAIVVMAAAGGEPSVNAEEAADSAKGQQESSEANGPNGFEPQGAPGDLPSAWTPELRDSSLVVVPAAQSPLHGASVGDVGASPSAATA